MYLQEINDIPPMSPEMMDKVRAVEALAKQMPQVKIPIQHYLHGGVYVRTARIPAGVMITGAHITIETNLLISGTAMIHTGEKWIENVGYNVMACAANRKQIFVAISDTILTMFFPTDAKTVKEAEERFTNEFSLLQTREAECQE